MRIRIGIDVGGTFTDAVAVDDETYELIGSVKIPTTHASKQGVAAGIVEVLNKIMEKYNIDTRDVVFIAHGTTQATNALLEGDVARVGIVTMGSGIEGMKAKSDSNMGDIPLAQGKKLHTLNAFVNTGDMGAFAANVDAAIRDLRGQGAESMVATEAFSVDNPENEAAVVARCVEAGIPATAGSDVSKLYGLKVRTRTAVVNASILPRMLETANMTEKSIKDAAIDAPLMVMRCDGGVMTVEEVRSRPILTILSGPAAGVAGALMYEKLTDGIFMEVGGTSTDISCVKDGNVMIRYASIGGHNTYLNSLDVRTVGIGGGSMVEMREGKAVDVGPRSSHIAGLDYEVYAETADIVEPVLKTVHPFPDDPEYAYIECSNGKKYALTLSGAANICGYVAENDYARGNVDAAVKAWEPLAKNMGLSVKETAAKVLDMSAAKNLKVVQELIGDYKLDKDSVTLVGGGGGAAAVIGHAAEKLGVKGRIARNAPVISPIGVALALVRDMVERTISNPTEEDILSIRREAIRMAVRSGADANTVEVRVEIDAQRHKVRAIAIGATELRTKDLAGKPKEDGDLLGIVAENLKVEPDSLVIEADNGCLCAITCEQVKKRLLFLKKRTKATRLIDRSGVIRLQKKNAAVCHCDAKAWQRTVDKILSEHTAFGDGGEEVPNLYVAIGSRIIDLSGMRSAEQIKALCEVELKGVHEDESLILVSTLTAENERG